VYGLADGLLRDLGITVGDADELGACYQQALERIASERSLWHRKAGITHWSPG
jgi:hypothetical protein